MYNIPCFGFIEDLVFLQTSHISSARQSAFNALLRLSPIRMKVKRKTAVDGSLCAVLKLLLVVDASHGRSCIVGALNNDLPSLLRPQDSDNTRHFWGDIKHKHSNTIGGPVHCVWLSIVILRYCNTQCIRKAPIEFTSYTLCQRLLLLEGISVDGAQDDMFMLWWFYAGVEMSS
jgi:hypothetical protein